MKEVNTALLAAIFTCLTFIVYYNLHPNAPNFKITQKLLSQEQYLKEKEKFLIDKIMRK
jgi:hypothetical protein